METLTEIYRPATFADVIGQDLAVDVLKRIAGSNGIPCRSIFLHGAFGSGKTTLARIFGRALNCKNFKITGDVCNECEACEDAVSRTSLLYKELDATQVGNVDAIKALAEALTIEPNGRRLVVIDEIHAASTQALNCLLKLVEDTAKNTIFMFCSTEDILPTLKSRSLCLEIAPVPTATLEKHLLHIAQTTGTQLTNEQAHIISMKSGGHVRDALQLLQLFGFVGDRALQSSYAMLRGFIVNTLSKHPKRDPLELLTEVLKYPINDIKDSVADFLRNVFTAKSGTVEWELHRLGIGNALFGFFFSPVAQQAFRTESGTELLLRSFFDKYHSKDNG